jgi:catechol 2,3-dioxygenase-like lactoylglutathione lyase family enzyme
MPCNDPGRRVPALSIVIADMNFSLERIDVVNLFAEDLAATKAFYQEVLGLTMMFDDETTAVFKLENMMICLTDVSAVPELIAPAAVARSEGGSRFMLAMFVDDVDAVCSELGQRGVVLLNGPADRPWGVRTANFTDPAGHIWQIAHDLG